MPITDQNIIKFFEDLIREKHNLVDSLQNYLLGEDVLNVSSQVDSLWNDVVQQHVNLGEKLKIIILAESPLDYSKYFYLNQGTFLESLRDFWGLKKNTELPDRLLKERVLVLDIYQYPIPSEFYKKDYDFVLFDNDYVEQKLNLLKSKNLIDDDTQFVFRYKELFNTRKLHKQPALKNLNFVKNAGDLVSLNKKEKPQKLNDFIAELLR
jgi:hypothetical protein